MSHLMKETKNLAQKMKLVRDMKKSNIQMQFCATVNMVTLTTRRIPLFAPSTQVHHRVQGNHLPSTV